MSIISPIPTDANGVAQTTGSAQTLGKDDFLALLVAQLQYQDPLEPMDNTEYVSQLAEFSSLEQMQNIADATEQSNEWSYLQMQSLNNVMASGFIGKEVKAEYSDIYYDTSSNPVISYTTSQYADEIEFEIYNDKGTLVRTLTKDDVKPGTGTIEWDGTNSSGNRVDEGYYSIQASAQGSAGNEFTPQLSLVGIVSAVVYRDGAAYLTVNGTELALGAISSIGEPGAFTEDD